MWILLVSLYSSQGVAVTSVEYSSKEACLVAAAEVRRQVTAVNLQGGPLLCSRK